MFRPGVLPDRRFPPPRLIAPARAVDIATQVRTRIAERRGTILAKVLIALVACALFYLATAEPRLLIMRHSRASSSEATAEPYRSAMCALAPML